MFGDFKSLKISELEAKILKFWQDKKIFEKTLSKKAPRGEYVFYDGPPFATGLPHYGHILASTIKDLIPRYKTMQGYFVRRRWGWDCHGLPIEEIVERDLGISGKKQIEKIGIQQFNETCRSVVLEFTEEWGRMIHRIARWVEFEDSYKTMDSGYMESVWWAFKKIYDKGLIYDGRKVLMYCSRCETPVSNFEVAMDNSYKDVTEEAVIVRFKIKSSDTSWRNASLLAWTTTPWTLPGNVALAVSPSTIYVEAKSKDKESREIYVLAKERIKELSGDYEILKEFKGKELIGKRYEPLFNIPAVKSDKTHKVYPGDFVSADEGTGVVHTAVVYGEEDYALGQKFDLPVVPLLNSKGEFNEKAPKFLQGMYFKKADAAIIADLEKRGLLFQKEKHTHSYPHCWRCGTPLFYNAIPAWFLNIQKIKKGLKQSNTKEIHWYPEHLKHGRYEKSVEQAPDWNISRNRYWGNPIPIWRCAKCNKQKVIGSVEELKAHTKKSGNKYFLMRHGEYVGLLKNISSSSVETSKKYPLTLKGIEDIKKSVLELKKNKIEIIFSSDLFRTRETAKIAAEELGLSKKQVILDKRLREVNVGIFDGKGDEKYDSYASVEQKFYQAPPKGENLTELKNRVGQFLYEFESKYKNKNILIISHEYTLWLLMAVAVGYDTKQSIKLKSEREASHKDGEIVSPSEVVTLDFVLLPHNRNYELDLHRPYIDELKLLCECGGTTKRISEIFDSWVEAASMPFAEYHYPFYNKKLFEHRFPAQFVAEYIAQTRAWFYVMHVVSYIIFGRAPFQNVLTTGTILAEDGSKMSKSKGNFPNPWMVIGKYGVDALRFYLVSSVVMQADNLNFNVRDLETIYRRVVVILQNVHNYFLVYVAEKASGVKKLTVLDKWILGRTAFLVDGVTRSLDNYNTVQATRFIVEYVDDLSTWYLRRSRGRTDPAFFETLCEALLTTSKIIAPFMPYLAEVLYTSLVKTNARGNEESVHLAAWPKTNKKYINQRLDEDMAEVRRIASLALAKRAEAGIKVRQPLASLKIRNGKEKIRNNKPLLRILADEINVKKIIFDSKLKSEVELDTKITPELKRGGIVREFIRLVQGLRQEAGYVPKDKIKVWLEVPQEVQSAIRSSIADFKNRVGAKSIEFREGSRFEAETESQFDGKRIWIGIKKV